MIAALAVGYLLGSIPFGLLVTRLAATKDIRQIGSSAISSRYGWDSKAARALQPISAC